MTDEIEEGPEGRSDITNKIERLVADHGSAEKVLAHIIEAAEQVVYDFREFDQAGRPPSYTAGRLVDLANAVFDLSTWTPGYDEEFH